MKKLKDDLRFLCALFSFSIVVLSYVWIKRLSYTVGLPVALSSLALFVRILKVAWEDSLEYLNGPKRFCRGRGIEIGSGGRPFMKRSLLVDIIDDFSCTKSYRVDYVADAHALPKIEDSSLDYVCASHVLEHLADPIKAIIEWFRILKPGGVVWLRIPDKRKTFDRKRERTTLAHLIDDFSRRVPTDDPTHVDDCNKNSDPPRSEKHPYVHNHVWIPEDMITLFDYIGTKHVSLEMKRCEENNCRNAQDFWILVKKEESVRV